MADLADIEKAMVAQLATALFTPGYLSGAYATSAAGVSTKLYRGWPEAANLDTDLIAGNAHVSVYSVGGMSRLTTRYPLDWFTPSPATPTLTVTAVNSVVTFAGTGGAGQVAGVQFGPTSAVQAYSYRLTASDTPTTTAAALAALIPGASASGAALTLPTNYPVQALVVADTTALMEVRRQVQGVIVSVWTSTPAVRDTLAGLADQAFAGMLDANGNPTEFLALPNGEMARVQYQSSRVSDKPSKDRLWRRDLTYRVEYATTLSQAQPGLLFPTLGLGIQFGTIDAGGPSNVLFDYGPISPNTIVYLDQYGNILLDAANNLLSPVRT